MRRALLIAVAALGLMAAEPAATPDRPLASSAQEARAQTLFQGIRCVVCQHESIADSPAGIAGDMRRMVREEIAVGQTDADIRRDLVRRYGDYILFKPPLRIGTWLLWFGPAGLILIGGGLLIARTRRRTMQTAPLSPDEEHRLAQLLQSAELRPDPDASSSQDGR